MAFIQLVTIRAKPGKAGRIMQILREVRDEAKEKEPETKHYYPAQNPDDENELWVWEEYTNDQAVAAHREGKAYQQIKNERAELIESLTIKRLTPSL